MNFPTIPSPDAGEDKPVPDDVAVYLQTTKRALAEALKSGAARRMPPFDWSGHTEFQQRVWKALCAVPSGCTRTYAEVAAVIGSPGALRAVGNACGANPIPILVPCHRVLAAGNKLGGFSGGLDWKRKLLAIESPRELFG